MYRRNHFPTLFDVPSLLAVPILMIAGGVAGGRGGVVGTIVGIIVGTAVGILCFLTTFATLAAIHALLNRHPRAEPPLLVAYMMLAVAVPTGVVAGAIVICRP
jgi:hypothetical protein